MRMPLHISKITDFPFVPKILTISDLQVTECLTGPPSGSLTFEDQLQTWGPPSVQLSHGLDALGMVRGNR